MYDSLSITDNSGKLLQFFFTAFDSFQNTQTLRSLVF